MKNAIGFMLLSVVVLVNLVHADPIPADLQPGSILELDSNLLVGTDAPVEASRVFQLRRETKLAGLRVVLKEQASRAGLRERRILNRVLADDDMLELTLAHVEWLEATSPAVAEDGEARTPVQDFLKFIIDNWDSIKAIIEFLADLFAPVPG